MFTTKKDQVCWELWLFLCVALVVLGLTHLYERHKQTRMITYHIEKIDPGFHLSRDEFAGAIRQAAALWEQAAGCELFSEQADGDVAVRMVYDYRQAACDKRKALSETLKTVRGSYENEQDQLLRLQADYEAKRASLQQDIKEYHERLSAFEMETRPLSGTVISPQSARRLGIIQEELKQCRRELQQRQNALNKESDQLAETFSRLNSMAARINSTTVAYSITGEKLGKEFCAGRYIRSGRSQSITIYQFDNHDKLICALAHELGHALGLDHVDDPDAIMYYHNNARARALSSADIAALKALPRF